MGDQSDNVNATVSDVGAVALAAKELASLVKKVVENQNEREAKKTLEHFFKFLQTQDEEWTRSDRDLNRLATYNDRDRLFSHEFRKAFTEGA